MNKLAIIIDDDPISILVCETILKKYKFAERILTFNSANKGLEYLKSTIEKGEEYPEFIFLDVVMPHKDGWGFLNEYVQFDNLPPIGKHVIMLSATFDPDDRMRAEKFAVVSQFLSKPITIEALNALNAAKPVRINVEK